MHTDQRSSSTEAILTHIIISDGDGAAVATVRGERGRRNDRRREGDHSRRCERDHVEETESTTERLE